MKRTYIGLSLATMLAVGGYFATAPSAACCGDGVIAAQGATTAGATVSQSIASAAQAIGQQLQRIEDTLANGFGKTYIEMTKQTASNKTIQEGVVEAETQIYIEGRRADAEIAMRVSPRACYELQAADAMGKAESKFDAVVQSVNKASADRTLYTPNTAGAVGNIYRTHAAKYCSDQDVRLGRCSRAAPRDLQNADIRADNLIARDALSTQQDEAADAFINNILNPMPTQMLPKGWESTQAGKEFIAGQMVEQSRNSVAANSFAHMKAMRTMQPGLGRAAGLDTPDVSMKQLLRAQTDGRFLSPQWYTMIAAESSEHNLLREMNKQMALALYIDYQTYEQNERVEAILAADMAANSKRDSEVRLAAARRAAAKAK